jgi:tetratricopeptide (TPR) repeat protein
MVKLKFLNNRFLHVFLIVIAGAIIYASTLDAPFQFDDSYNTVRNPYITDLSNIPAMFMGAKGTWASRPLLQSTVALNFRYGGFETRGYHILNTCIHLINGLLLYMLVVMTGRHLVIEEDRTRLVGLFSSLLFVVHPLHTETVISVVNRSMLFATMFCLVGMALFLKAVTSERRKGIYTAALFVVSLLGMASRENFATFPLMLLAYDLFFISRVRLREALKHWKAYLPVLLSLGYMALLALNNTYDRALSKGIQPIDYALTQLNVHWTYLRLLVLPVGQNVDYDYDTAKTLFELPTLVSFIGYLGLWAGGVLLARKRPLISFSVLWFLIALLPISFVVTVMGLRLGDVIFEHRAYLPSVAFFPAFVSGILYTTERLRFKKIFTVTVAICITVIISLSIATYERNKVWKTEVSLWEDAVRKSPNKSRPHYNFARFLGRAGFRDRALIHYRIAIALNPRNPQAHFNVGVLYLGRGLLDEAREEFETTVKLNPKHPEADKFLKYVSELEAR